MTSLTAREQFAADVAAATDHPTLDTPAEQAMDVIDDVALPARAVEIRRLADEVATWTLSDTDTDEVELRERHTDTVLVTVYLSDHDYSISHHGQEFLTHY